ncbi:outer membrane beta-barrel protein [bacterium]|nr:outer membrane beta-barrel protein [bacterium]
MKSVLHAISVLAIVVWGSAAQAYEQGDWILRFGAITVAPEASSQDVNLPDGLVAEVDVDDDTQLGFMPVYMMTDNIAFELVAATPFEHDIEAKGKGAIKGTSLPAGSTKHLPPTLMFQYYPRGGKSGWQPYAGIGINYTVFFDEDVDDELVNLLGDLTDGEVDNADLDLGDSFGLAFQVGVDVPFYDNWAFNAAVWYMDIDTEASITAKSGGMQVDKVEFDVHIDPWVYNLGIAYRF